MTLEYRQIRRYNINWFFNRRCPRRRRRGSVNSLLCDTLTRAAWLGPVIFDWFVLNMRMQVILDSSVARPGSAPIWGGKKGEFRDWTMKNPELPKQNGTEIATSMPNWEIDWKKKTFQLARTCTKSTKIIIFQFKFLHRRLPTNSFLHKIAIKDNDLCTFCQEETDTLLHLFWQCKVTSLFWGTFFQWLQSCSLIQKGNHLVMTTALGLKPDSSNTKLQINFSCLMSRYHIWKCISWEMKLPTFHNFFAPFEKNLWNWNKQTQPPAWKMETSHWQPLIKGLSAKIYKTQIQTAWPYQWYYRYQCIN